MQNDDRDERRRVLVPQALGSNEFLRATWHRSRGTVVISQWVGAECAAAIPVRVGDLGELARLITDATSSETATLAWPAPHPGSLVVPDHGLPVPMREQTA